MKKRFTGDYALYLRFLVRGGGPRSFAEAMAYHHVKGKFQHLTISKEDLAAMKVQMEEEKKESAENLRKLIRSLSQGRVIKGNFPAPTRKQEKLHHDQPIHDNVVAFRKRKS